MTISSTTRKAGPYTGNGITTAFTFSFKVFQASDLYVVQFDPTTGTQTVLTLTTSYTVVLNSDQNTSPGGTVTLLSALASGYELTITSDIDALQSVDLTNQGGFYPAVINSALDKLTILIQQALEGINRALQIPISSQASAAMPTPEASAILGWDSSGTVIENYSIGDLLTVAGSTAFMTQSFSGTGSRTAYTLSATPGDIANLEVYIAGVRQIPSTDYTLVGQFLTFTTAPISGTNNIFVRWGQTLGAAVPLTLGSVTNSVSGTSVYYTGIPSWARKITVSFAGVSTTGTAVILLRLGTSSGINITGYDAGNQYGTTFNSNATGFPIYTTGSTVRIGGAINLTLVDPSDGTWAADGVINAYGSTVQIIAGNVTLSGTLDRVQVATTSGNSFDLGRINILYQ